MLKTKTLKAKSNLKTKLSENEKKQGEYHIYILIGMISVGIFLALYNFRS